MRRKSTLFIVLGVLLLLAAGGVAAMSLTTGGNSLLTAAPAEQTVDPAVPVVVAQLDLPKGTLIDAPEEFLSISEVPASQFDANTQFNDLEALRDMVALTDIKAGDVLRQSAVREAGLAQKIPAAADGQPSVKAFPIQVNNLSGVADLIQSGDFIDVVGSFDIDDLANYTDGDTPPDGQTDKTTSEATTKVLLQDVEVVDVIKPTVPVAEGEAQAEASPAPSDATTGEREAADSDANTLANGNWIIVLAVTDAEAEVLRFTLNNGINLTTILRRAGDHTIDETVGASLDVLVKTYGLPQPSLLPTYRPDQAVPAASATP